ncbi:MAG: dihydrolipoamide acetyltransferase family protein [Candidatus Planktophila sp.]|nr:dihydrolipoamide acetyltransferase family protein [Candidatus Planktophila sp.]
MPREFSMQLKSAWVIKIMETSGSEFEFRLPDVGEGLEDAEIIEWKVSAGERIQVNQLIVEIETAKALVELPTPFAGTVLELLVHEGQVVHVGTPIIRILIEAEKTSVAPTTELKSERTEILVGSGPRNEETSHRKRATRNYGTRVGAVRSDAPKPQMPKPPILSVPEPRFEAPASINSRIIALAKPPVRRLARDCGVDLLSLTGSGPEGSITHEDVLAAANRLKNETNPKNNSVDEFRETRTPIHGVRRVMAEATVASAFTAPHVTEFVTVDVTSAIELLDRLRALPEFSGVRLSILSLLARAMCIAMPNTPEVNSFWDVQSQEVVTKHYINLGVATATDRGLLVPNVKNAEQLNFKNLAKAIEEVVDAARTKKASLSQLTGGTMSITNIGVFGVETGTPILPPGESAIVCLGAIVTRPWVVDSEIVARHVCTLSLSFDHRLVDGAQGSKFLTDIAKLLQEPSELIAP